MFSVRSLVSDKIAKYIPNQMCEVSTLFFVPQPLLSSSNNFVHLESQFVFSYSSEIIPPNLFSFKCGLLGRFLFLYQIEGKIQQYLIKTNRNRILGPRNKLFWGQNIIYGLTQVIVKPSMVSNLVIKYIQHCSIEKKKNSLDRKQIISNHMQFYI